MQNRRPCKSIFQLFHTHTFRGIQSGIFTTNFSKNPFAVGLSQKIADPRLKKFFEKISQIF